MRKLALIALGACLASGTSLSMATPSTPAIRIAVEGHEAGTDPNAIQVVRTVLASFIASGDFSTYKAKYGDHGEFYACMQLDEFADEKALVKLKKQLGAFKEAISEDANLRVQPWVACASD